MKILIAMRSVQQSEGGPITAVAGLTRALQRRRHSVDITAHDDGAGDADSRPHPTDLNVRLFPRTSRVWEHSRDYARWLKAHVADYDLVIVNSLWISHVHYASRAARLSKTPYIIRPHGCLNPADMDHKRLMKTVYWNVEDRKNSDGALFLHSTSEQETNFITSAGVRAVETIPLGIDSDSFRVDRGDVDRHSILFVGRIAQKKGVDLLIRALAEPELRAMDFHLNIVGVDHRGLQAGLEALAEDLGVVEQVHFRGHADAAAREVFLAEAGVFALPSTDENFGLAVAEAMAATVPVVVTPGVSHAAMLERRSAGIVIERDVHDLAAAIRRVADMDKDQYDELGLRGRQAVVDLYGWDTVAEKLELAVSTRLAQINDAGRVSR